MRIDRPTSSGSSVPQTVHVDQVGSLLCQRVPNQITQVSSSWHAVVSSLKALQMGLPDVLPDEIHLVCREPTASRISDGFLEIGRCAEAVDGIVRAWRRLGASINVGGVRGVEGRVLSAPRPSPLVIGIPSDVSFPIED